MTKGKLSSGRKGGGGGGVGGKTGKKSLVVRHISTSLSNKQVRIVKLNAGQHTKSHVYYCKLMSETITPANFGTLCSMKNIKSTA